MVHFIVIFLTVILFVRGDCFALSATPTSAQDQATVTDQEKKEVQEFARQFVARLLKTRDIRPLIAEFFLNDFTAVPKQDFYEKVAPELYAKLSKNERVRLFVAQENLGYIITLDVMTQTEATDGLPFQRILPVNVARKLSRSRLVEGTAKFTTRKDLFGELSRLERAILEARSFLKRKNLEQSETFLKKLHTLERDPHLGYRVRASVIDEDLKREFGFAKFAAGQKMFSVDTPVLIELIVAKDGGKFKILTLVPADGD
jgi:hypothetical protein